MLGKFFRLQYWHSAWLLTMRSRPCLRESLSIIASMQDISNAHDFEQCLNEEHLKCCISPQINDAWQMHCLVAFQASCLPSAEAAGGFSARFPFFLCGIARLTSCGCCLYHCPIFVGQLPILCPKRLALLQGAQRLPAQFASPHAKSWNFAKLMLSDQRNFHAN